MAGDAEHPPLEQGVHYALCLYALHALSHAELTRFFDI